MIDRDKAIEILSQYKNHYFGDKTFGGKISIGEVVELLKNPSFAMDRSATVKELAKPKLKITCTEYEKDWILGAITTDQTCCLLNIKCQNYKTCRECLEKNIEWTITDN